MKDATCYFSVYSRFLAARLMEQGFSLEGLTRNWHGQKVYLFEDDPILRDQIDKWMVERAASKKKA